MTNFYKTFIRLTIGVGILFFLFYYIGISKIISTMLTVHPIFVFIVIIAIIFEHICNGFALKLLADNYNISLIKYCIISLKAWSLSIFTPGRVGDFSMIYFMNKAGITLGESTAFFLLNRSINIAIQFSIAGSGIIFFELRHLLPQFCITVLFFCTIFCVFIMSDKIRDYSNKLLPEKFRGKLTGFAMTIERLIIKRPFLLLAVFQIQFFKILITHGFTLLMFLSIGQQINFWHICAAFSLARIISLIPVSVNGLGIKESALVYFLGFYSNVGAAVVMSVILLNQVIAYTIAVGILFKNTWRTKNTIK